MNPGPEAFLAKAIAALEDARLLVDYGRWTGAVSRSYYAMLHAAKALLDGGEPLPRDHAAIHAAFERELMASGAVDLSFHGSLVEAFERRLVADFEPEGLLREAEACDAVRRAAEFVHAVRESVRQRA